MPTRAVQFTILSIIALGYKSDVTPYVSELSSILLPVSKSATIDKTLFFEIYNRLSVKFKADLEHILNFAELYIISMYRNWSDIWFIGLISQVIE